MAIKKITPQTTDRMTCLVIGASGRGKTSLLRTIPEGENALVISAESGLLCVRDLVVSGKVTGFEIDHFLDVGEIFFKATGEKYTNHYKWIFIDSLTEIADLCALHMKEVYPNPSDSIKKWNEYTEHMKAMVKAFRDMPHYNVVFTCLDSTESDEAGIRYTAPKMQGKAFKGTLTSLFDEVFYLNMKKDDSGNDSREFVTQPIDRLPAKDRSGKLNTYEEPDLSVIANKIMANGMIDLNSSKMKESENGN